MKNKRDIIIGAGLTGLSCGYILKNALILEKNPYAGGLAHTFSFGGLRFDIGGHRFLTHYPEISSFIKDLLKDDLKLIRRRSKIFKNNKFLDYPPTYNIVLDIALFRSIAIFVSYMFRKIFRLKEISFKERTINRFGDVLYNFYFKNYTKKVWGISCENISKDWVEVRLPKLSLRRAFNSIFFRNRFYKTFSDKFVYPRHGISQIVEKLTPDLDVKLNSSITGIEHDGPSVTSVIVNNNQKHKCRRLISTMPIIQLTNLLNPPEKVASAISKLRYRDIICVFLVFNAKSITSVHWIYFPDEELFGRVHEPKNWSSDMAPPGKSGLCFEIFSNREDEIWRMSDENIIQRVTKDMPFKEKNKITDSHVIRIKDAYPIYDLNYKENLKIVKEYLSGFKNLHLTGRTGNFNYINMDDCIREGLFLGSALRKEDAGD